MTREEIYNIISLNFDYIGGFNEECDYFKHRYIESVYLFIPSDVCPLQSLIFIHAEVKQKLSFQLIKHGVIMKYDTLEELKTLILSVR